MELTFSTVGQLCSSVNFADEQPCIDLSDITFFRPFALVYLGMFLRYHAGRGIGFIVRPPVNAPAREYLDRQRFWERFNLGTASIQSENLHRFGSNTSFNDIFDIRRPSIIREDIAEKIANDVVVVLEKSDANVKTTLVWETVVELVDNFSRHSGQMLAVITMQYYPNVRQLVIAIGDCGIGIRQSLASNPQYEYLAHEPHYAAALKAFEPLVTCKPGRGGSGLLSVREDMIEMHGTLVLATGDGYVRMGGYGNSEAGNMAYNLPGVQIEMAFPEETR